MLFSLFSKLYKTYENGLLYYYFLYQYSYKTLITKGFYGKRIKNESNSL